MDGVAMLAIELNLGTADVVMLEGVVCRSCVGLRVSVQYQHVLGCACSGMAAHHVLFVAQLGWLGV